MRYLRSFIFDAVFYSFSCVFFIVFFPFIFILKEPFVLRVYFAFAKCQEFFMKALLNLTFDIKGKEILNQLKGQNYIIAMQHQSAFDTIIPPLFLSNFILILKRELFYIPFFGFYLKKLPSIFLKRKAGISSLKHLLQLATYHFNRGKNILIYPEGTRQSPYIPTKCQPGIFVIYKGLNCKVLPVTLNSGIFWPKKAKIKWGGHIAIQIHPPLQEGLSKAELLSTLDNLYNT
ncbi:MAG: 1-acyl-sn-glycerol-3-phosphate acyltransferase [Proteobacteria bacterium]|nr:1-acyl-sn-glycerol-3-phosphate acyltransferase [Pseudomonadota bacterium]